MKEIIVPYQKDHRFSEKETLNIDTFRWADNSYTPKTEVYMYRNDDGFKVKFVSYETNPRREVLVDGGEVWCDSCVEFFVKPFSDDERYLNLEVNPNGAMVMEIGTGRENRQSLIHQYKSILSVATCIKKSCWTVEYAVPFDFFWEVYNKKKIITELRGNFYKCGDKTKHPHFGMWNPINNEFPDFHLPQFFGRIIL